MKKLVIILIVAVAIVLLAGPVSNLIQKARYWSPLDYITGWGDDYQGPRLSTSWQKGQLLDEHNDLRRENGLNSLRENGTLNRAAQKHADYMAERSNLSHYGEEWSRPSNRVTAEGYDYIGVAENIATGQRSVDEVMKAWMDSSGHQRNIMGNHTEIGFGIAYGRDGRIYWCVVFGQPRYEAQ